MQHESSAGSGVVVVGAGFAGLNAARRLARRDAADLVRVTVIDQRNHHTFQPLLYQVATAGLNPQDVGYSVRALFRRDRNVRFRVGTVVGGDLTARELRLDDGERIRFDHLVLAAGAVTNDLGVPGVEQHTWPLKSIGEALQLRNHVLGLVEQVERDPRDADRALRFVVVGGGATGVEMAGALVELLGVLRREFPSGALDAAEVVLVEALDSVLSSFHPRLQRYAVRTLAGRGVRLELGALVERVEPDRVVLADGRELHTRTTIWVAGVRAHPLATILGVPTTRGGRVVVGPDLRVPGHDDVYVIGDLAAGLADPSGVEGPGGELLPQLAPVAIQQGRHVGEQILRRIGARPLEPFRYRDKGTMATIGRSAAVAELRGGIRFRGFLAWLAWLGLHLLYLIGFRNRLSVLLNWSWNYLTYDRGTRLIVTPASATEPHETPPSVTGS